MKKLVCFCLLFSLLLPLLVSCGNDEEIIPEVTYIKGYDFIVSFGSNDIKATQINSTPEGDNVVIYTRDYKLNNEYSMNIGVSQEGRVGFAIRCSKTDNGYEFDVVEKSEDIASVAIPYNGFAMSVPACALEGVRANKGQIVKVSGYDSAVGTNERHDGATIAPDYLISVACRRVSIKNPAYGIVENKIYFIDENFKNTLSVPFDNVLITAKSGTNYSSDIISVSRVTEISAPKKGEVYYLFTGEYNIVYANHYFKNAERVSFSLLDKANAYSDSAAIVTDKGLIELNNTNYNVTEINKDGIYVFDRNFSASVTPSTNAKRTDVIVVDGYVALVNDEGERSLIPDGNGFVITFVGDSENEKLDEFKPGKLLNTCFIEYEEIPEKYVEINGQYFEISFINGQRSPEGVTVLYTSAHGDKTGTNQYGTEIVIQNGKVTAINNSGDNTIPENGYVLSIHKDSPNVSLLKKVNEGDTAKVSFGGSAYALNRLVYTGVNETRFENTLIVYQGVANSRTNPYGFEIAVDADGVVIEGSHSGSLNVPKGGFVLSGHGVNKTALEESFSIGQRVYLDPKTKEVVLIKTPEHKLAAAEYNFAFVSDALESAKKSFLNLDYKGISEQLNVINGWIEEAEAAFKAYDYDSALAKAESVVSSCENLRYALYESKGVENRAVWYRCNEKNDEQVTATIQKLKKLNINALFLETWYEGYCIGSKVEVDGMSLTKDNGGYDVLEAFVRIGHEYGIEIHAWVHDFFVGYYYKGGPAYYNTAFDSFKGKYLVDKNGNDWFHYVVNNNYFIFLNPFDRECRDLILDIYEQLITKYELDGLHLDYIRFPELNPNSVDFGYNEDIINEFKKETGFNKDPRTFAKNSAEMKAWIEFRCNIITSFVGEVYELVRDVNKSIWLSAATYPDLNMAKNDIFQDVKSFVDLGYLDEVFSMSYGVDESSVKPSVNSYVPITKNKVFYSAGIAAFLETTPENFANQLSLVEQLGADGVSIFALSSIKPDCYQHQITEGAFRDPAVQVYKLSVTAAAQMDYISNKVDNITYVCNILGQDQLHFIKAKCSEFKEFAVSFDYESAGVSAQVTWCKDALAKLSAIKSDIIEACGKNAETNSVISEFEDLEYWLTLSQKRLETRK